MWFRCIALLVAYSSKVYIFSFIFSVAVVLNCMSSKASYAVVKCFFIYFDESIVINRASNISIVLCNELMHDIHNSKAVLLSNSYSHRI